MSEETVTFNLVVDTTNAKTNIVELNKLFTTYLALADKAGLPPNIIEAMRKIQQFRILIETTYRSLMILYTATGPVGWAIALGGLGLSAFMMANTMEARRPQY